MPLPSPALPDLPVRSPLQLHPKHVSELLNVPAPRGAGSSCGGPAYLAGLPGLLAGGADQRAQLQQPRGQRVLHGRGQPPSAPRPGAGPPLTVTARPPIGSLPRLPAAWPIRGRRGRGLRPASGRGAGVGGRLHLLPQRVPHGAGRRRVYTCVCLVDTNSGCLAQGQGGALDVSSGSPLRRLRIPRICPFPERRRAAS